MRISSTERDVNPQEPRLRKSSVTNIPEYEIKDTTDSNNYFNIHLPLLIRIGTAICLGF